MILKDEIAKPEYAGLSDDQIVVALAAKTVTVKRDVPIADVQAYLSLHGRLTAIEDWLAANPSPSPLRTACKELMRCIETPRLTNFAMADAATFAALNGMLSALASAGIITADDLAALVAMSDAPVPWWQSVGLPSEPNIYDIEATRA